MAFFPKTSPRGEDISSKIVKKMKTHPCDDVFLLPQDAFFENIQIHHLIVILVVLWLILVVQAQKHDRILII